MAKGLDAFFVQERGQGPTAPHPDTPDNEPPVLPFFAPEEASDAAQLPAPGPPDPDINVMLSALEPSADREPKPSVFRHVPAPDDGTPTGPVLARMSPRTSARQSQAERSSTRQSQVERSSSHQSQVERSSTHQSQAERSSPWVNKGPARSSRRSWEGSAWRLVSPRVSDRGAKIISAARARTSHVRSSGRKIAGGSRRPFASTRARRPSSRCRSWASPKSGGSAGR